MSQAQRTTSIDNALAAWGETMPEWIRVLAEACDCRSQKRVAEEIGYSATVINQVLKGTYKGDLHAVEQAVRGALLAYTIECPVLGELRAHHCLEYQRQPFANTNPQRIRLYQACRSGCPHARLHH